MLVVPESFRKFTWIGIDPGLSQCGFSVFEVTDGQLSAIKPFTIITDRLKNHTLYTGDFHSEREIRMSKLCDAFRYTLYQYGPSLVCSESPFFNRLMPGAYGSLRETVAALRLVVNSYNPFIPFIQFSPQEVKQTFKRSGQVGKLVMKEALLADQFLCSKLIVSPELLDEHSVDATAVGYTWYKRYAQGAITC